MIIETTSANNAQVVVFNLCGVIHAGAGETLSDAAADLADILVNREVEGIIDGFEQCDGLLGFDKDRARFFDYARSLGYRIRIPCVDRGAGKTYDFEYLDADSLEELNQRIDAGYDFSKVDFSHTSLDDYVTIRFHLESSVVEFIAYGGSNNRLSASSTTMELLKERLTEAIKDFLLNHK